MWDEVSQINTIYKSLNMDFSMEDLDLERWAKCVSPGYQYHTCQLLLISGDIQQAWCWLRHWGRHKMADISLTTFSNVFSSMKMFGFGLKFRCSLFLWVQLTIFQHWFRLWLGTVQATSHYLMLVSLPTHICVTCPQWLSSINWSLVTEPGHHWPWLWVIACAMPSHYLNQCWLIIKRS